ncbi:MAG: MBL fold metallo-hydrolase [Thermodesulfobacteriota bacterium]|nr:MBL fold metallo-hydrolase [Thermodesulfobacteriota bacterium]
MDLIFLGTGAAWGLPQLNCDCFMCREMRLKGEKRQRTALLLSGESTLLIDCGPDIASQLSRHKVSSIDAVLITHEHGDHYFGLDELYPFKLTAPKKEFCPILVYLTSKTWEVVGRTFGYLDETEVIRPLIIEPGTWFQYGEFEILPFDTYHGLTAKGSVGFAIKFKDLSGREVSIVYTSDLMELAEIPVELFYPDYLIIETFWLNHPVDNLPCHMSFQKAIRYIERLRPRTETFLVHIGDSDMIKGDPANIMSKKSRPKDPLRPPSGGEPYHVPLDQAGWQETVERIMSDRNLPYKVTVACDDLCIRI